ncbi:MAG: hypothetical protein JKY81_13510 [Colwellia sp.]|nr:hypothetical protein [Colwellia sp.]
MSGKYGFIKQYRKICCKNGVAKAAQIKAGNYSEFFALFPPLNSSIAVNVYNEQLSIKYGL